MAAVAELRLPEFDYLDTELRGERFHRTMIDLAGRSWLAKSELGYFVLDRESAAFFLRTKSATFPGMKIAELFEVEDGPLYEEMRRNILHINGDAHRRLRNLVNPAFTPRSADRWRPAMREFLGQLWQGVEGARRCEFVADFAKPYPSLTIATVMGAPLEDAPRLHDWSNWIQRQFDPPSLMADRARIERAVSEFYEWCEGMLAARRGDPRDDLVSTLLAAEAEGDTLSDVECMNLVLNVLVGGVDTTQSQLTHAIRLFAAHPDQWRLLAERPELAPQAVEEVLRFEPTVGATPRIVAEEFTFRDVTFPVGTAVGLLSVAANQDPDHVAEERDVAQTLDAEPVQVIADREVDDQRHQTQADGGRRQPAPAGVEVVEAEADQRDHQHDDRHMGPAHGGGIGLRCRRLEHAELAEGDPRGGDGGERERQRRLRAAMAPPDWKMNRGERQAGRGDHRPDDRDETHPARVTATYTGRVYLPACKEMRYVKASRAGRASQ